jgi:hypothetical protein
LKTSVLGVEEVEVVVEVQPQLEVGVEGPHQLLEVEMEVVEEEEDWVRLLQLPSSSQEQLLLLQDD